MEQVRLKTDKGWERFYYFLSKTRASLICDQRLVNRKYNTYFATGSIDRGESDLWKLTTEMGYEVSLPKHWELPVLRSLGKDIRGKDIKGYVDIPLSEVPVGEAVMLYQKPRDKGVSYGFNKACPQHNNIATMITMIQARPDRFITMDESTGKLKLILDTVREKGWFNIHDLNSFRPFAVSCSDYINRTDLPMMKNLHWFGYKSHCGELVYDLSWLEPKLRFHGLELEDLYREESFHYLYNCSHLTFKKIMKFLIDNFFMACGSGKKTKFALYHDSDQLLRHIQVRLLDYGIISKRYKADGEYVSNQWRKHHLTSYLKHLKRKNVGNLGNQELYVLEIHDSSMDKFVDLTTYSKCDKSDKRKLKALRACKRAKNLCSRNVYWDRVKTIEKAGKGRVYRISVPNGKHIVLNGLVVKN